MERTFRTAYKNVCDAKKPISTLKDVSQIKGFGKLMTKLMQGYFAAGDGSSEQEELPQNRAGKKAKERKRYIPRRNSAGYALLITLHRETMKGKEFMFKQDLIDATEVSGLSHVSIRPEKGRGKPGLGNSKSELYSGWSSMTTLRRKGLATRYSSPAKYMMTVEGREVANECIKRSGLPNSLDILSDEEMVPAQQPNTTPNQNFTSMRQENLYNSGSGSRVRKKDSAGSSSRAKTCQVVDLDGCSSGSGHVLKPCSSSLASDGTEGVTNVPHLPPLTFGQVFEEAFEVILILDDREQFATRGSRKIVDNICSEFKIKVEVRRLPVGDCIWIARHKCHGTEYVLDFILERKSVDDLHSSIQDNRYTDQKLRLLRSGLKKLIYIVEGDLNQCNAAQSLKTACFTTEIRDGFTVLRTNGLGETLRTYGDLTHSIYHYYNSLVNDSKVVDLCPSFDSFVKRCQDLDIMTISDVFAIQLMQASQVTEEIALAVLDTHPTLSSLASAYSRLEGNVSAQEQMLKNQSNNVIGASASKNIFRLVWSD